MSGDALAAPAAEPLQPAASDEPVLTELVATESIPTGPVPTQPAVSEPAVTEPAVTEPLLVPLAPPAEPVAAAETTAVEPGAPRSILQECFTLYQEQRFEDVVARGTDALEADTPPAPGERAPLWGVIGLARQELSDYDGARSAFEEAITAAAPDDRAMWQRHLGSLALVVAQSLLARVQREIGLDATERVAAVREAITWLEGGRAAAPADEALREALGEARDILWPAYEEAVTTLMQGQEFHVARRLLREALADEGLPPARDGAFRDLLSATFSGEVGQLTAEALRQLKEASEDEALASLERAEGVLATIPDDALSSDRRQELRRRLWWAFTKVGLRRVEAGDPEAGIEPLFHAFGFHDVGPERRDETRAALVQAFELLADARALAIRRLAEAGQRDAAVVQGEKLWALLRGAMERGLSQDDLGTAFARTQEIFDHIGGSPG